MIKVLLFLNFIILACLQGYLNDTLAIKKERRIFLYPPSIIHHLTLGYRDPLADSMWIGLLKDIDVCDQAEDAQSTVNQGKNLDEILSFKMDETRCKMGWVYSMVDTITTLSPDFKLAYLAGATSLSIVVRDATGAAKIYDKAINKFPNDGQLLLYSAYHFLFEMQDAKKAAGLLYRAAQNGAPPWTYSLAARLYDKAGQAEFGHQVLIDFLKTADPESEGAKRAQMRLKEIEASIEAAQKSGTK